MLAWQVKSDILAQL